MTTPNLPDCPAWCQVSIAEHIRDDDPQEGGFLHYRLDKLENHYARNHLESAPTLSVAIDQDRGDRAWIMLEASTYLTAEEARTLATKLLHAATIVDRG